MDTSGKDGTIRQVMAQVNPVGCEVRSFKGPTSREQVHDFLWRIHRVVPGRGMISIFNLSHYEDVLVLRVHDLLPETVGRRGYSTIYDFWSQLAQIDKPILQVFLNIQYARQ